MQFPPVPRKFARLIALCLPLLFLLAFLYTLYLEARLIVALNRHGVASPVMNVILALPFVAYAVGVALSFAWTFHCRGGIRIYGIVLLCAILLFFFALTAIDGSHIYGETEFGAVRRIELPSRH